MTRTRSVILSRMASIVAGLAVLAHAQPPAPSGDAAAAARSAPQPPVRFAAVDVFIDSGAASLAAYQFELTAESAAFKIVGIEGGDHPAFAGPPYYDVAVLHGGNRVIIAAFNTAADLPAGHVRVARVHVQIVGNQDPLCVVQLHVAADASGEEIPAQATCSITTTPEDN